MDELVVCHLPLHLKIRQETGQFQGQTNAMMLLSLVEQQGVLEQLLDGHLHLVLRESWLVLVGCENLWILGLEWSPLGTLHATSGALNLPNNNIRVQRAKGSHTYKVSRGGMHSRLRVLRGEEMELPSLSKLKSSFSAEHQHPKSARRHFSSTESHNGNGAVPRMWGKEPTSTQAHAYTPKSSYLHTYP